MEFRLLGPVEVWSAGRSAPLGGTKQRTLLAVLALRANRVVPLGELMDALWPQGRPRTAAARLHDQVFALRRALRRIGAGDCLATRSTGYLLQAGTAQLDHLRFADLVGRGRRALAAGDPVHAVEQLRSALAMWRGAALTGTTGDVLSGEAAGLEEARLAAVEDCTDAELRLGRAAELVPELSRAVAAHPLRERLVAHLMLALYRAGRHAEALQVYRDARRRLAGELGLEPGGALGALQTAILRRDPGLDHPYPAPAPPGVALDPELDSLVTQGAHFLGMTNRDLVASAVREYLERRSDELRHGLDEARRVLDRAVGPET